LNGQVEDLKRRLCENLSAAVQVTALSTSTDGVYMGMGTVKEPKAQEGQPITIQINKPFQVGQTIKQCVNLIVA